jgi:hypothetical protein
MEDAEVLVVFSGLPAFFVVAAVDLTLLWFILSKVKSLLREHFTTD